MGGECRVVPKTNGIMPSSFVRWLRSRRAFSHTRKRSADTSPSFAPINLHPRSRTPARRKRRTFVGIDYLSFEDSIRTIRDTSSLALQGGDYEGPSYGKSLRIFDYCLPLKIAAQRRRRAARAIYGHGLEPYSREYLSERARHAGLSIPLDAYFSSAICALAFSRKCLRDAQYFTQFPLLHRGRTDASETDGASGGGSSTIYQSDC